MLIRDMTDEQLADEWHMWNEKVSNATSWGAALSAADEFRKECEREIRRRGIIADYINDNSKTSR